MEANRQLVRAVRNALDDDWQTTQEIATRSGVSWPTGQGPVMVRTILYAMELNDVVEHQPRQNGHFWKLKEVV